jgi:hypothetical protein
MARWVDAESSPRKCWATTTPSLWKTSTAACRPSNNQWTLNSIQKKNKGVRFLDIAPPVDE